MKGSVVLIALVFCSLAASEVQAQVYPQWDKVPLAQKMGPANLVKRISWKYYQKKKYPQALKVLDIGLKASPGPDLLLTKARLLIEMGRLDEAREITAPLVQQNLKLADLTKTMTELYLVQGRFQEAEKTLEQGWDEKDPSMLYLKARSLVFARNFSQAQKVLENLLQLSPDDSAAQLLLAQVYKEGRTFTQAQSALENLVKKDPGHFEAQFLLAKIQELRGKNSEALAVLLKLDPKREMVQLALATNYLKLNKVPEAASSLQKVREHMPLSFLWHFLQGKVQMKLKQGTEARQSFAQALSVLHDKEKAKKRQTASESELTEAFPPMSEWNSMSLEEIVGHVQNSKGREKKFAPLLSELYFSQGDFALGSFYKSWGTIPVVTKK